MSAQSLHGQSGRTVSSNHAEDEYAERFDGDVPLITAWERGIRVEAPDKHYHEARFYPPTDLLMTVKNGVITTAMYASRTRVKAPGKVQCQSCGHPHEALQTQETCPWCGATADGGRSTGAITITTRGEGN
jgi:rubrerythrin